MKDWHASYIYAYDLVLIQLEVTADLAQWQCRPSSLSGVVISKRIHTVELAVGQI